MEQCKEEKESSRKIPRGVPFILGNMYLERFATTGTSAILALYLHRKLNFDPDTSTAIFHTSELMAYLFPILGAIIADSWWGHFKTISMMLLVFVFGSVVVFIASVETLPLPHLALSLAGLMISVFGSGNTRANITAFGANQYQLPEQAKHLTLYFSLQIFFIKCGSLTGRLMNPILKQDVKCFGEDDCYPLAFGAAAVGVVLSLLLFLVGNKFYVRKPPGGNMLVKVSKCVLNGISEKFKQRKLSPKSHWLDYAEDKFGPKLVAETKTVLNVLVLYIPLPIYWAVYQLQGSRWTFQAAKLDGNLGFYTVKPDQMIVLNPIFGILALPISDYIIFPLLAKIRVTSLLQKMTIGGFLVAGASCLAAYVEIKSNQAYISIFWQAPQYLVTSFGENFVYNSHLTFAYNEAPASMKSVMTSFVFVVIGLGNAFVIVISGTRIFESQAIEFFFFAGVLIIAMIGFAVLASQYKTADSEVVRETKDKANDDKVC